MNEIDRAIAATEARRAAAAAAREARVSAPDPVAVALAEHSRIIDAARDKAEAVMPVVQHAEPEPPATRYPHDYVSLVLPDGQGLYASFLVETMLRNSQGPALFAEVLAGNPGALAAVRSALQRLSSAR
jgi:hypothetical protein